VLLRGCLGLGLNVLQQFLLHLQLFVVGFLFGLIDFIYQLFLNFMQLY
jgi:hypothetical protein